MSRTRFLCAALLAGAMSLLGCASVAPSTTPVATANPAAASDVAAPAPARITVLVDAFGRDAALRKDWGYAALVEVAGKRILFDTGNSPEVLAHNARAKGVDLTKLNFVVMSHRHGDHMGGMNFLLSQNPGVRIYAPKEGFGVYGGDLPGGFYRRDDSLPPEQRYYDGNAPEVLRFGSAWPQARFTLIDKTTEIAPGVHLIALVSDKVGTLELRELSLAIQTPAGLVLVVGCSHPGVDKIVQAAVAIQPQISLIIGGLHHVTAKDEDIASLVTTLHDTHRVSHVAPGHCSGEPTFTALKKAYGANYLYAGVGSVFELGRDAGRAPRALADRAPGSPAESLAFDERDADSYQRLLTRATLREVRAWRQAAR